MEHKINNMTSSNMGNIVKQEMQGYNIIYYYDSFYLFGKLIKVNKAYSETTIKQFLKYLELLQQKENTKRYNLEILKKLKNKTLITNIFQFDNLEELKEKSKDYKDFCIVDKIKELNHLQKSINNILLNFKEIPIII